jgi:hypothetical protein
MLLDVIWHLERGVFERAGLFASKTGRVGAITGCGEEGDLFIQVSLGSYSIAQVPITYRRRPTKQKLHSIKDGLKIAWKFTIDRFIR